MKPGISDNFGLYAILTDPVLGYDYLANVLTELEVPLIQLRVKDTAKYKILRIAEKLCRITENSITQLIINDYPLIAVDSGADGLHIGQNDISYDQAREIIGPEKIIGISTHNIHQVKNACAKNPDYIGIGPIFETQTKKTPDPVIGIEGMKDMLSVATVPVVCIGGITVDLLPELLKNGACNFCMVKQICASPDPASLVKKILKIYNDNIKLILS